MGCQDVAFGDGVHITVGSGRDVEMNRSEEDGKKWRKLDLPGVFSQNVNLNSIAFGNGVFVAVTEKGDEVGDLSGLGRIRSKNGPAYQCGEIRLLERRNLDYLDVRNE